VDILEPEDKFNQKLVLGIFGSGQPLLNIADFFSPFLSADGGRTLPSYSRLFHQLRK
jgi:hypothetical protein